MTVHQNFRARKHSNGISRLEGLIKASSSDRFERNLLIERRFPPIAFAVGILFTVLAGGYLLGLLAVHASTQIWLASGSAIFCLFLGYLAMSHTFKATSLDGFIFIIATLVIANALYHAALAHSHGPLIAALATLICLGTIGFQWRWFALVVGVIAAGWVALEVGLDSPFELTTTITLIAVSVLLASILNWLRTKGLGAATSHDVRWSIFRQMSAALADTVSSMSQLEKFASATTDSVVLVENEYIDDLNQPAADLFGYRRSQLIGRSVTELFSDDSRDKLRVYLNSKSIMPVELTLAGEGRQPRRVVASSRYLVGNFGRSRALTLRDVTDQRLAERRLRQAEDLASSASRAQGALLSSISHHLRTPLSAIVGYSELLLEDAVVHGLDDLIPDLEKVRKASLKLSEMVSDLLDVTLTEAGSEGLQLETFELQPLVEEILDQVRPALVARRNSLDVEQTEALGRMTADLNKVRYVLLALLNNAIRVTENGQVRLKIVRFRDENAQSWIKIEVLDTGIGLTKEQVGNLNRPFVSADPVELESMGDTGLGLALCGLFCHMMNGNLRASSELGSGTSISVMLPADVGQTVVRLADRDVESPTTATAHEIWRNTDTLPTRIVLIVSNQVAEREILARYLFKKGVCALTVEAGDRAVELARAALPGAIIVDLISTGTGGWTTLAAVCRDPQLSGTSLFFTCQPEDRNAAFALGATEHLSRPLDYSRMWELLAQYSSEPQLASRGSVLLMDHDPRSCRSVSAILASAGWTVVEAVDGSAAHNTLSTDRPDITVLEPELPGLDWSYFVDEFLKNTPRERMPVVVHTSAKLSSRDIQELSRSTDRIIQKRPPQYTDLLVAVHKLVASSSRQRAGSNRR